MNTLAELLNRAEAAIRARDVSLAERLLSLVIKRRETLTNHDLCKNGKELEELDERMKFVWRWLNPH